MICSPHYPRSQYASSHHWGFHLLIMYPSLMFIYVHCALYGSMGGPDDCPDRMIVRGSPDFIPPLSRDTFAWLLEKRNPELSLIDRGHEITIVNRRGRSARQLTQRATVHSTFRSLGANNPLARGEQFDPRTAENARPCGSERRG